MRVLAASEPAPGRANEDRVAHAMGFVCVLDGVTTAPDVNSGCIHGPAWYVDRLTAHLLAGYAIAPQADLVTLLRAAIVRASDEHAGTCDLSQPSTPASTVCLLRENPDTVDYLVLCDTTLVLDTGTITAVTDDRFAKLVEQLRPSVAAASVLAVNRGYTPGKWDHVNRAGGYWIAAANPDAADNAITGTVSKTGHHAIRRAALLTDGASCAVDKLGLMDWAGLLDLVEARGPEELIAQVRDAERAITAAADGTKPHDDATVALCLFDDIGAQP